MTMPSDMNFSVFGLLLLLLLLINTVYAAVENMNSHQMQMPVPVRVVLGMNSSFSAMINSCLDMAISDFYASNPNYETRLQLHKKEAKNALDFHLAVLELVKQEQVAILGSQGSMQEAFAAAAGEAAMVPIVSFTAKSLDLPYTRDSYFVRTTLDHEAQAEAVAAICRSFGWPEVVILYEHTENGNQFLSRAIKAFQDVGIRLTYMVSIPVSAEDSFVEKELNAVKAKQTRLFLVHLNPELGSRVFSLAGGAGMMSEGYAWIVTDSISIFLNSMSPETRESMDGVLGVRPYVFESEILKSFRERWKRSMVLSKTTDPVMDLNIYGLWAYDTVTALAIAVENVKPVSGIGTIGTRLVSELSKTKFGGLAGDFELVEGRLKCKAYEIFNIIGNGERRVGFWSEDGGISREVRAEGEARHSKWKNEVKKVVWPGDSVTQPKGWTIPPLGSLRVGVPSTYGFPEFGKAVIDPATNKTRATGFAVDIFLESLNHLPFQLNHTFHFINVSAGVYPSYDMLLQKEIKVVDILVSDTTIWAPRAEYVDFSLPYSESGIVLVVRNKKPFDMWIFIRPLRWDLWVAIFVSCLLMGVVLYILENRGRVGPQAERPGVVYWFPIAILAFQDRNMVSSNWSVFVLVCWLFMAFILMQSFTANLSAILTLDQLKFSFSQDHYVGYQEGSFMRSFLTDSLHINEMRLRSYSSIQGFHEAMFKGSKNGGIDAIFDELPYMKLLLNRYESQYRIVGPTYRTDGFGFAFPPESPLVRYFSRAILNVTQGPMMSDIERKNFGPGYSSQDPLSSVFSQGTSSLALHEFAGLFLLTGSFIVFALFCSQTPGGQRFTHTMQHFIQNCLSFWSPPVHSTEPSGVVGDATHDGSLEVETNVNGSPPPSSPGEARDVAQQDDEEVTGNESSASQTAAVGVQNEEFSNSQHATESGYHAE